MTPHFPPHFRSVTWLGRLVTSGRGLRYIRSLYGHIGPIKRSSTEQHVSNKRVNGSFADESHKEQLLDDLSWYGAQWRKPKQQFTEARRLSGILCAHVLLEGTLRLLLQVLDVCGVRQTTRIYTHKISSCTVCLKKNIPNIFSCNSRKHCRIFIMFGTHVNEKVSNQYAIVSHHT